AHHGCGLHDLRRRLYRLAFGLGLCALLGIRNRAHRGESPRVQRAADEKSLAVVDVRSRSYLTTSCWRTKNDRQATRISDSWNGVSRGGVELRGATGARHPSRTVCVL